MFFQTTNGLRFINPGYTVDIFLLGYFKWNNIVQNKIATVFFFF